MGRTRFGVLNIKYIPMKEANNVEAPVLCYLETVREYSEEKDMSWIEMAV